MQHYEIDSAHAAARVLSLALMADGVPDKAEFDCLRRLRTLEEIGIDDTLFESVLQRFCQDVEQSVGYFDALHYRLPSDFVDALLDEVQDPQRQRLLLRTIFEIAIADGYLSEGEKLVLARAASRWGDDAMWPVRIKTSVPS